MSLGIMELPVPLKEILKLPSHLATVPQRSKVPPLTFKDLLILGDPIEGSLALKSLSLGSIALS